LEAGLALPAVPENDSEAGATPSWGGTR
jgi:hypothetical protein